MRRGRGARRLLIDLTPVRRTRDLRCLVLGQLISVFGTQLTTVAVPYQVYQLTRSSLDVGLVSLAQLFPLIAGHRVGGLGRPGVHRRGAAAGPSAARLPPSADAGACGLRRTAWAGLGAARVGLQKACSLHALYGYAVTP